MPSYLIHFNRLHDKRGRFTYGDGDGDGRRDDRKTGEGDRSYDTPNSGRRNYEGGGGGRIGGGRTSSGKQSKSEVTKNQQYRKSEYRETYSGKSKGMKLPYDTADHVWDTRNNFKTEMSNVNSLGSNHSVRRISSNVSGKISSFGSTPPKKTPEVKPGVGNGRPIGRDYGGTSRGAAAMAPINDTNNVAEELTEDMLEKRKKDEVKDYWQKKYQNAVAKGRSYVDMLFGKETTTNAKSSDKYKKVDTSGNHDKRK